MNSKRPHPYLSLVRDEQPSEPPIDYEVTQDNRVKVVVRAPQTESEKNNPPPARLKIYLSIMKPITWVPVVWSFWCGAIGSGGLKWTVDDMGKLWLGLLLSGPLLCGMSQAVNDYFDREVDAVNEPGRSIPSQRITLYETVRVIACLGCFGLAAAYFLGQTVLFLSILGIILGHLYSAPPVRLKAHTWLGPLTSATAYILLPWLAATCVFGSIGWRTLIIASIYTVGAMGIMISNDFKSIFGDFTLKLPSVPVVYGTRTAAKLACYFMDGAQIAVIIFLFLEGHWLASGIIVALLAPQIYLQRFFIAQPLARAVWYNARGQNFFVLGMLIAAWLVI